MTAPSVPQYQPTGAGLAPLRVPQAPGRVDQDLFGAAIAQQQAQAHAEQRRKRDKAASMEFLEGALLEMNDLWYGENGGKWKNGKEYLDWAGTRPVAQWKQRMSEAMQELPGGARAMAEGQIQGMQIQMDRDVKQRFGQAEQVYYTGRMESMLESLASATAMAAADPARGKEAVLQGLAQAAAVIEDFSTDHGEWIGVDIDDWNKAKYQQWASQNVARAIKQANAGNNDILAKELYDTFGHLLDPDKRIIVGADVTEASFLGEVARTWEGLHEGQPIMMGEDARYIAAANNQHYRPPKVQAEHLASQMREVGRQFGWSQQQIEQAVEYARRRGAEELVKGELRQAANFEGLMKEMMEGDARLDDLRRNSGARMRDISIDHLDALKELDANVADNQLGQKQAHWWMKMNVLGNGDLEDKREFQRLWRSAIPLAHIHDKSMLSWLRGMNENIEQGVTKMGDDGLTTWQRIQIKLEGLSEDHEWNQAEREEWIQRASAALLTWQQTNEGEIPSADHWGLLNNLGASELYDTRGQTAEFDEPLGLVDIVDMATPNEDWLARVYYPSLVRQHLEGRARALGVAIEDLPPSETNIADIIDRLDTPGRKELMYNIELGQYGRLVPEE